MRLFMEGLTGFYHEIRYNRFMIRRNSEVRNFELVFFVVGLFFAAYGFILFRNPRIAIEWQTATEIDTVGFNLYRAENSSGPYIQINKSIIPSSNEPLKGGEYKYVDANVVPNQVYYYQLEDIDTQGKTTRHEPIRVQAKAAGILEMISGGILSVVGLLLLLRKRQRIAIDLERSRE